MKTVIQGIKRPGRPPLADIVIKPTGSVYIPNGAYERYWKIPGSRGPLFYNGADLSYYPATYEVAMRPTIYTGNNAAVTPMVSAGDTRKRGCTMRLRDFLNNQCGVELIKTVRAFFEQRGDLLVFSIKGCIA